ncbi:MAG TPA: DUF1697 domain-containing protein [Terriglobales bacterium]
MPVYISMLRGINIGPHKRMKMEKLRESLEDLGFSSVKTYIQSGNVVFKAAKTSPLTLSKKVEERILADFGFSVNVITRTSDEMGKIIQNNPLLKQRDIDGSKLHVTFLSAIATADTVKKLESLTLPPDKVCCSGTETYFYFPNGVSGSSVWKYPLDRVLAVTCTMRNWNTVSELYQMALECK